MSRIKKLRDAISIRGHEVSIQGRWVIAVLSDVAGSGQKQLFVSRESLHDTGENIMIRCERMTADLEGDFVVFMIGVRINAPLRIHKWLPVIRAMPRMLVELHRQPELGFIHAEMWFARTTIMVQYWRSMEQLMAYAKLRTAEHLPAWKAFNKTIGTDGSVGIWHETYSATSGSYENVYVNMPAFGLGRAGNLRAATGGRQTASGRLNAAGKDV